MDVSVNDNLWTKLKELRYLLYSVFFFFMPFTQALTFNIGFPLKLSELALIILFLLYIVLKKKVAITKPIIILLATLFFVVTISFFVNLFWSYGYPLKEHETRFSYNGDSIARYIYFVLALCAFFISLDMFLEDMSKFAKIWIFGAMVAAAYAWYLVISSFLKLPVYLLPGMKDPPQMILGGIIRSGTFLEGNMMGLYLLISGGIAFYIRKFGLGLFLLISVLTSFSTLSVVAVFVFLLLYFRNFFFRKKYIPQFFLSLAIAIPLLLLFTKTEFYRSFIYEKLFGSGTVISSEANYSKVDRLVSIKTAYYMGIDNPILGVGLSNYSRHAIQYFPYHEIGPTDAKSLERKNSKTIPNNIYAEVWSEIGVIGLGVFIIFLIQLLSYARNDRGKALLPLLVCVYFCFNAYPSFIMIYLWSFMALPVSNYVRLKNADAINY